MTQQTGMIAFTADEYLNHKIFVAHSGRWFIEPHKNLGVFGVAAPTVEHREQGDVPFAIKPQHTPSLLEQNGLTPALVTVRTNQWMADLKRGIEESKARREGVKVARQADTPKPLGTVHSPSAKRVLAMFGVQV